MISAKDIKDGTEAGASLATSLADLFPGTAARSMTNAHSYSVQALMEDLNKLKRFAKENNISEELQKALVQFAFERHGASERLAQCVEKAVPFLEEGSSPENLDPEWLDYWRVHASSVRSSELQEIWGAILANEVNRPGAISKRAMSILSTMDRDDAMSFEKLCSYTVVLECEDQLLMIPVLNESEEDEETFESYNSGRITLDDIDILSECRLIVSAAESLEVRGRAICRIGEDTFEVVPAHGETVSLMFGSYSFTRVGAQLASTIIIGKAADAAEQTRKWLAANTLDDGEIIMRPLASA